MPDAAVRTVHVEPCMGTVFSFDLRDADPGGVAVARAVALLHRVDRVFSTYRADSDITRLNQGKVRLADVDPEVAVVFDLCADVRRTTGGWFDPLVDGRIDPTGLVKGWAVEAASRLLTAAGVRRHAVNGGGDVQVTGGTADGRPWRIGIADPRVGRRTMTAVAFVDGAVATSGVVERGRHLRDPFTGRAVDNGLRSATVTGPSLTLADCYATAAFAMGPASTAWIADVEGYECLLVDDDGRVRTSAGWGSRSGHHGARPPRRR